MLREAQILDAVRPATVARATGLTEMRVSQLIAAGDIEVIRSADGAAWVPTREIGRLLRERAGRRTKYSPLRRRTVA